MAEFTRAEADAVLQGALDRSGSAREKYLDESCGQGVFRALIERLLEGSEMDEPSLRPGGGAAGPLWEELARQYCAPSLLAAGDRLGPWRIARTLGHGGMASVYLAQRADGQFEQAVALKVLDVTRDFASSTVRFNQERQILARLDHPNIAHLIDGGSTPTGQPYVVMEFVDGEPIDAYCDRNRLSIARRIDLFIQVADAVHYAHGHLIVHRDIKPSNILVGSDGRPKLLDFGIAKLLDPAATLAAPQTRSAMHPMTPEYASPEQVRAEALTTASDVYQLGFLLYGLLAGRSPYVLDRRNVAEMVHMVCSVEPMRLSQSALPERNGSASLEERSAARSTTPERLRRSLAGDLDNILAAALRKEPSQRYASVLQLRDDLQRHLQGRPVMARPPTLAYRAGKFIRRNRMAAAATVLLLVSLVIGLVATTWQARLAAQEARRVAEVRDFLVELFESVDPDSALGATITAKELLDRGAERLSERLAAEPLLRAEMLGVVGRMYTELGLYTEARPLLEQARAMGDAGDLERAVVAQTASDLARVLYEQGEHEAAERLAREALENRRAGREPAKLSDSLVSLASILSVRGQSDQAEALFDEALQIDRSSMNKAALAAHLHEYSAALSKATRLQEAQQAAEQALALQRELHGEEHTLIATTMVTLANILAERGVYSEAEPLLRQSLFLRRKLLGDEHPHVALVHNDIGHLLMRAGRLDEAQVEHLRALEIQRMKFGEHHPEVVNTVNFLGIVSYYTGESRAAVDAFTKVLTAWREVYGNHHQDVYSAMNNLGAAQRQAGDYDAAEATLRESLALRRQEFGDTHQRVAQSLSNLALLLVQKGAYDEAEALFRQAIAMWRQTLGADHPDLADGLTSLGKLVLERERYEEAEVLLREAVMIRIAVLAPEAPLLASGRLYLGESLVALNRASEAIPLIEASLPILSQRWGEEDELTQRARRAHAAATRSGER